MARTALDGLSADDLQQKIAAEEAALDELGATIAKARKAQRAHLDKKDDLVNALNAQLRTAGSQNLGG